ncbi:hypothetical protein MTE01_24470 [Microbacterium testaceum]|uniref:Uncharacterized protein n=1 Tax=Microbacterium testaceum TaxID=2033 RepID=A0A4Y3QN03_MICTE|nr:hypothetical protein [Microbacterium testaceum]WJS89446.1 hypothetical protein NYQ11_08775 [Microbacterium testaceum]GEB46502.1 hypothetical protein MTE01_24470 [Microbacterium testaceum]
MHRRDDRVPRRVRWTAVLVAALVLGPGTLAAHAVWSDRHPVTTGVTSTGSLGATASWAGSWSAWQPLVPGRSSDTAALRVSATGSGDTLRWRVNATASVSTSLAPYVSTQVFVGACGTGTPLPAGGFAPAGGYALGASVDLCLRVTLDASAPSTTQATALTPQITVTVDQATS